MTGTLQSQQIVTLACQIARCPGFTSQAGQYLNEILSELCQTYDFDLALTVTTITLGTGTGAGPYPLPTDYLRGRKKDIFWTLNGVPYPMIQITKPEYDMLPQTSGFSSFPTKFATDMSTTPPNLYVYPPASGAYVTTLPYYRQTASITTPETSTTVPWFPFANYLITRLAGELMKITGDKRIDQFLGDDGEKYPNGAGVLLRKYLIMKDDPESLVKRVELDPRRFGTSWAFLPNTKQVGF